MMLSMQMVLMLQGDEAWQDFAMPQGTLDDFLNVAEGVLCGPTPQRGSFGANSTMTGQVLPSTHAYDDSPDESPPEHVSLDIAPEGEGEGPGVSVHLSNGQLHSAMNDDMRDEAHDWG